MLKKVVMGTLLVGLIGILVVGGITRTLSKTAQAAEARGQGHGKEDGQGQGQGAGAGQAGQAGRGGGNREALNVEWVEIEGTVVQSPDEGGELVIQTADGEQVTVGAGPSYTLTRGFALQAGELVQVRGYWEGEEFKVAQVTRMSNGQTIALRDETGRPAWAGGGRSGQEDQGNGQASGGQGNGQASGDQAGAGQAYVDAWLTLEGSVTAVDGDVLLVQTSSGQELSVENRSWWFAQESGFSAAVGDQIALTGFYEGDDFEVGKIENLTSGQTVLLRDDSGRPGWAGGGRRGG